MKLVSLLLLFFCIGCDQKEGDSAAAGIQKKVVTENLHFPWEILWGPDNKIWMTERGGRISQVDTASGKVMPIFTIAEVKAQGEGGLLGMVLDPRFSAHPYVYVAYDYEQGDAYKEKIVRYVFNGTTLTSPFTIIDNIDASGIHNGCRLLISPDLKLFITTGDASNQSSPQNDASLNGKILRLNLDGSIPADNPIAGSAIWSKGHRNPQGLVFVNNILYSSEHGPDSDDEINIIEKGRNYGWQQVKGFCNENSEADFCKANHIKEPVKAWTPTIAVTGMDFYNSDLIPEWKNSLLVATLKHNRLMQLKLNTTHTAVVAITEFLTNEYGRLRDICVSPGGNVYACTSNGENDKIIMLYKK